MDGPVYDVRHAGPTAPNSAREAALIAVLALPPPQSEPLHVTVTPVGPSSPSADPRYRAAWSRVEAGDLEQGTLALYRLTDDPELGASACLDLWALDFSWPTDCRVPTARQRRASLLCTFDALHARGQDARALEMLYHLRVDGWAPRPADRLVRLQLDVGTLRRAIEVLYPEGVPPDEGPTLAAAVARAAAWADATGTATPEAISEGYDWSLSWTPDPRVTYLRESLPY